MELRSGAAAGPSHLPESAKEAFEEGVGLVFSQWTALCLAVENEWGGPMSRDKADLLIDDIIQWFYRKRGEPTTCPPSTSPLCRLKHGQFVRAISHVRMLQRD